MEPVQEPIDVDFYFDDRQMTEEDQKRVSDFIALEELNILHRRAEEYLADGTKTYTMRSLII